MIIGKNIIAINLNKEMISLLYDLGYKIMEVPDCIEGIRLAIRFQPDLVIAEINSPNLNGLSMASILSKLNVRIPLVLTGSDIKYKKPATSFDNVNGFLMNPGKATGISRDKVRSDFEAIIFNLDNFELSSMEFAYSFRQHEWANLLGKSNKKRILIVEDDESFIKVVLKRLDSQNTYNLFSAKDGLEGVFKAFLVEPHLILTDINMPNIDGMAMSQMFFILNKPFPIVFLTALELDEIQPKMKKAFGVIGIMEKEILSSKAAFFESFEKHLADALAKQKKWKREIEESSK